MSFRKEMGKINWNGQRLDYIGKYDFYEKCTIYLFNYNEYTEVNFFMLKSIEKIKNECLFDEIKPIFGLTKVGMVYGKEKKKLFLLKRCVYDKKIEESYPNITIIPEDKETDKIMKIIIFRWFFNLGGGFYNIKLRKNLKNGLYEPVSYKNDIFKHNNSYNLTFKQKKYFMKNYGSVGNYFLKIFNIESNKDINIIVNKIAKIIKRVYLEKLYITSFIKDKLRSMLRVSKIQLE